MFPILLTGFSIEAGAELPNKAGCASVDVAAIPTEEGAQLPNEACCASDAIPTVGQPASSGSSQSQSAKDLPDRADIGDGAAETVGAPAVEAKGKRKGREHRAASKRTRED